METRVLEIGLDRNGNSQNTAADNPQLQSTPIVGKQRYTSITVLTNKAGGTGVSLEAAGNLFGGRQGQGQTVSLTSGSSSTQVFSTTASKRPGLSVATMIAASIALPLPTEIAQQFSQDWATDDVGPGASVISNAVDFNSPSLAGLKGLLANEITKYGSTSLFKKALKDHGVAYNPYKEMFYNGVNFRTFAWTWDFAPTSEKEYNTLEDLIYNLELHSHPDFLDGPQSPFIIPDTFQVEFVNTKLPKMRSLVLTEMTVNYSNGGDGPRWLIGGEPAYMSISLTFLEVDVLTKKRVTELRNK